MLQTNAVCCTRLSKLTAVSELKRPNTACVVRYISDELNLKFGVEYGCVFSVTLQFPNIFAHRKVLRGRSESP